MMRRIRLIIEYDGTAYVGWQTQKNGLSIQAVLERELFKITGERIALHGSGRTDSGVHALAQVAHFDTLVRMPADKFTYALNTGLPADIRIRYSDEADLSFHSRFSAKNKHYRYTLSPGPHGRVFCRNTALHVHGALDLSLMQHAARALLGQQDFCAFMASGGKVESTVRTIYRSEWSEQEGLLFYDVEGNGFLYNMVRIFAGTMLSIGKGLIPQNSIELALLSGKRTDAGPTAPAHGLMLMGVRYEGFDTNVILNQGGTI